MSYLVQYTPWYGMNYSQSYIYIRALTICYVLVVLVIIYLCYHEYTFVFHSLWGYAGDYNYMYYL